MKRCRFNLRPDEDLGYKIELMGECGSTIDQIMEYLGKYGKQYLGRRLVYVEEDSKAASSSDSK